MGCLCNCLAHNATCYALHALPSSLAGFGSGRLPPPPPPSWGRGPARHRALPPPAPSSWSAGSQSPAACSCASPRCSGRPAPPWLPNRRPSHQPCHSLCSLRWREEKTSRARRRPKWPSAGAPDCWCDALQESCCSRQVRSARLPAPPTAATTAAAATTTTTTTTTAAATATAGLTSELPPIATTAATTQHGASYIWKCPTPGPAQVPVIPHADRDPASTETAVVQDERFGPQRPGLNTYGGDISRRTQSLPTWRQCRTRATCRSF